VVLIGRVGMSTPFLHRALQRGVETILLDDSGAFLGRVQPGERGREFDRRIQFDAAGSDAVSLRLARGFVLGKLQNQRVMLQRLDRKLDEPILGPSIRRIDKFRYDAERVATLVQVRGLEGAGARDYFQAIGDFLTDEWGWKGRVRRPPPDPVNAMLSFGYTLLSNEGVTAAELAGLDPDIGFLHLPHPGRPSLALDLVEEFRPLIVDSTVFAMIGRKQVRPTDFEKVDDGACRMSKPARDAFLTAYEKRMLQLVTYRDAGGRRISYRTALHMQARSLSRAMDSGDGYLPVMWR
jgi:CRISPR-associated protein Cas1